MGFRDIRKVQRRSVRDRGVREIRLDTQECYYCFCESASMDVTRARKRSKKSKSKVKYFGRRLKFSIFVVDSPRRKDSL